MELLFGHGEAFTVSAVHNQNDNLKEPQRRIKSVIIA